jgi:hypothetical protein
MQGMKIGIGEFVFFAILLKKMLFFDGDTPN